MPLFEENHYLQSIFRKKKEKGKEKKKKKTTRGEISIR